MHSSYAGLLLVDDPFAGALLSGIHNLSFDGLRTRPE